MFGAVELVAGVAIPYLARRTWFYHDDWDFLASRTGGNLGDLFRPHNEHWSTLPILAYRGLWQLFGLRHYTPYLMLDVVLHLALGALLLVVLGRCRVRPWLATAAALLFVLFGSGQQDIARAFQIGFVGSLVFGFLQLVCANHDGPIDRRDWTGLAAGAAGLMCSGIAAPMVVVVGVATFLQRGKRVALFHVAPLAAAYAVWFAAIGHEGITSVRASVGGVIRFITTGLGAVFGHLGQVPGVGIVLGVMLVIGSVVAWRGPLRPGTVSTPVAISIACLVGLSAFLVISATGRDAVTGAASARVSRYLHVEASLLIVPLGVAAEALVRRRRELLIPALALFLVGIPGNITSYVRTEHQLAVSMPMGRQGVLWAPRLSEEQQLSPATTSHLLLQQWLTLGWLVAATADGKVPSPDPNAATERARTEGVIAKALRADAAARACGHPPCIQPKSKP